MLARIWSAAVRGIEGYPVGVELDIRSGLPRFTTVGLPDGAVREARDRVVSAVRNSGFDFPDDRVTVNLAPAERRKAGTQLDLPIGMGVLAASGQLRAGEWASRYCFLGELALDGSVRSVSGVLAMAFCAKERGLAAMVVPRANRREAALTGIRAFGVSTLREAADLVRGAAPAEEDGEKAPEAERGARGSGGGEAPVHGPDLRDVRGQLLTRRALEVAAAGGHNIRLMARRCG